MVEASVEAILRQCHGQSRSNTVRGRDQQPPTRVQVHKLGDTGLDSRVRPDPVGILRGDASRAGGDRPREKQIKGRLRAKKVALIESRHPGWRDLSDEWVAWVTSVYEKGASRAAPEILRPAKSDGQASHGSRPQDDTENVLCSCTKCIQEDLSV